MGCNLNGKVLNYIFFVFIANVISWTLFITIGKEVSEDRRNR